MKELFAAPTWHEDSGSRIEKNSKSEVKQKMTGVQNMTKLQKDPEDEGNCHFHLDRWPCLPIPMNSVDQGLNSKKEEASSDTSTEGEGAPKKDKVRVPSDIDDLCGYIWEKFIDPIPVVVKGWYWVEKKKSGELGDFHLAKPGEELKMSDVGQITEWRGTIYKDKRTFVQVICNPSVLQALSSQIQMSWKGDRFSRGQDGDWGRGRGRGDDCGGGRGRGRGDRDYFLDRGYEN
ncbi:hypothetical protein PR202_gb12644 [Eleusine coracana subsp. coracana]|uniref:Uncharacterized protein n=1 Tax=Eleusine coracana subsp. coracana TaxID=191504 RepID=A0AAV5EQ06_ELECO|nr:hypothetical protein PR202_gb12644 [Eleusine coracana subsp. coracana]